MELSPIVSVIIPTRNRATSLSDTLDSLLLIDANQAIEFLIIDNGSTDNTRCIAENFAAKSSFLCRYVYEPCPGLHVGRNLGASLAKGDIIVYFDDDVYVPKDYFACLMKRFEADPRIALLGGPCLPYWEEPPPDWIFAFRSPLVDGWILGILSLIDQGNYPHPTSGQFIFGCNFAVKKSILLEAGGFHPDGLPDYLLRYRGDGETYIGEYVDAASDIIAFYDPCVFVKHRVPCSRLTKEYFESISKRIAISNAYTLFRTHIGFVNCFKIGFRLLKCCIADSILVIKYLVSQLIRKHRVKICIVTKVQLIRNFFSLIHYLRILISPSLQQWVRQKTYFNKDDCPYKESER